MDVVSLSNTYAAAREATPVVPVEQRPPESGRDCAGPGAGLRYAPVRVMTHHDARGIAGQALRRSSWNAATVFEHGLAGLGRVGQDWGIDVDHDLVALARGARIDAVMKRGLGQQRERVGLLLLHRRLVGFRFLLALPLAERLSGGLQCLQEEGAHLRSQAPTDLHHAVFVWIHVQRPADVLASGVLRLGLGVHSPPTANDTLDMLGRTGPAHREQPLFGLGRGYTGQLADLGVRELAAREGLGQERERAEGAGHADVLAGGAGGKPHAPGEPGGARAKAIAPATAPVELANEIEQA
jgi:hypothetical protein